MQSGEEEDSSSSRSKEGSTVDKEEAAQPEGHGDEEDHDNGESVTSSLHGSKWRCVVCSLELNQIEGHIREMRKAPLFQDGTAHAVETVQKARKVAETLRTGNRKAVARCLKCKVFAHSFLLDPTCHKKIHKYFPGKTCMEIVHSDTGKEIWKIKEGKATTNYGHTLVKEFRMSHRLFYETTTKT